MEGIEDIPEVVMTAGESIEALAATRGVEPDELAYDLLVENGGHGML
jgi:hypothetical protein